jgi:hypothetical protein
LSEIKRYKTVHNFETAKSAGILFQCTEDNDFEVIRDFRKYLEKRQIETLIAGFVNAKQIPDFFLLRQGFNCFCLKDLNWIYIPDIPVAGEFLKKEFDLMFDLSLNFRFPIHYLASMSKAHYKIGRLSTETNYDLMIDISKENKLAYFTGQIIHYLNIIHRSNNQMIEDTAYIG